jgi:SAM-dependent methyltransferase
MLTSLMSTTEQKVVHPPGTVLQHLYLAERLSCLSPGRFIEVGIGNGHASRVLLDHGWRGTGYDLNSEAVAHALGVNSDFVASKTFEAFAADWLNEEVESNALDLVLSSMVLEHLDDADVSRYFAQAARALRPGGRAIFFVPGSPRHWGIEDEIAGHYRRYTTESFTSTVVEHGWRVAHIAGLTYPLSNLLLSTSNRLVSRAEADKQELELKERTELSGDRDVPWKTGFPSWTGVLLNETAMRPFHWLQKHYREHPGALVIYCECTPPS